MNIESRLDKLEAKAMAGGDELLVVLTDEQGNWLDHGKPMTEDKTDKLRQRALRSGLPIMTVKRGER